jgi:hypothetical protein
MYNTVLNTQSAVAYLQHRFTVNTSHWKNNAVRRNVLLKSKAHFVWSKHHMAPSYKHRAGGDYPLCVLSYQSIRTWNCEVRVAWLKKLCLSSEACHVCFKKVKWEMTNTGAAKSRVFDNSNTDTVASHSDGWMDACLQLNGSRSVCVANMKLIPVATSPSRCPNFVFIFTPYLMTLSAAQAT